MTDLVRFVDSIPAGGAAPTVRLDLNDGAMWGLNYQGTDMSPPGLKEAWAGTLLADGEQLTAAAYTNRRLKLNLDLITTTVDDAAAQLQLLWRELNRPRNFLMWQPEGATHPVYFRTLRSSDNTVAEYPGGGSLRTLDVVIAAEPFAYGPKEQLAPVTVFNDPAAGANGCWFEITGVKGDVETPLIISLPTSALALATPQPVSLFAIRRRGTPSLAPFVRQAEALTLGTDATLPGNDPAMSGPGSNYVRVSFATQPAMDKRLSGTVSAASFGVDLRGTYRVLVRVRNTAVVDYSMQLAWGPNLGMVFNDQVNPRSVSGSFNVAGAFYIDLGLMQVPSGSDPVHDGYSGVELSPDQATFSIWAKRNSGSGSIDIDHVLFVPADDRMLFTKWPNEAPNLVSDVAVLDGPHEQVVMLWTAGGTRIANCRSAELSGGFPAISPGAINRVSFVRSVGVLGSSATDPITGSTVITPSYYPRYLYVRPVTT